MGDMTESKVFRFAANCMIVLSLALGLANLSIYVFKWGVFTTEVRSGIQSVKDAVSEIKAEVKDMRDQGSPKYSEHVKLDDYVRRSNEDHFKTLDAVAAVIPTFDKKLALIDQKLDSLQRSLEDHKEQTKGKMP